MATWHYVLAERVTSNDLHNFVIELYAYNLEPPMQWWMDFIIETRGMINDDNNFIEERPLAPDDFPDTTNDPLERGYKIEGELFDVPIPINFDFGTWWAQPPPDIDYVDPAEGSRGESINPWLIYGENFGDVVIVRLERGTAVIEDPDIEIIMYDEDQIYCSLDIPPDAEVRYWDVYVENEDGQSDTLEGGFYVILVPILYIPWPNCAFGNQGQIKHLIVFGEHTDWNPPVPPNESTIRALNHHQSRRNGALVRRRN